MAASREAETDMRHNVFDENEALQMLNFVPKYPPGQKRIMNQLLTPAVCFCLYVCVCVCVCVCVGFCDLRGHFI